MKAALTAGASALAYLTAGVAPPPPAPAIPAQVEVDAATGASRPAARLPGFAPELSDEPRIVGPAGWRSVPTRDALAALASAPASQRQAARWTYALSLISGGRAPEALGVLDVMLQDDPDLALVENFQLARGRVFVDLSREDDALAALDRPGLALNPEACAWRARALEAAEAHLLAVRQLPCAKPALAARSRSDRAPFLVAAADAALGVGDASAAFRFLGYAAQTPEVAATRGEALVALGRLPEADLAFAAAGRGSDRKVKVEAEIGRIEVALARRAIAPAKAIEQLTDIRYRWRGDRIERRALWLSYRVARDLHQDRAALAAGATLVRYHQIGPALPPLIAELQGMLSALLAPDNKLPIDQAAGLYWDYRDMGPSGADGDLLVARLADRLQAVGLYARSAELLEHQLLTRVRDLAQGPLSVRVAKLHILAGHPDRALAALRATANTIYPQSMLWDRQRMEAIALHQLGRGTEAVAVLQDVPDAEGLRAELLWKQRNWQALVAAPAGEAPAEGRLSDLRQAVLLRRAIALAMLGREADLAALRARYAPAFANLPSAAAFDLLTQPGGAIDPDQFAKAMTAIPAVSPAGALADLIDAAPAPVPARPKRG